MLPLNPDLHSHSDRSDGVHDPATLIAIARDSGADCLALTDHDTLAGLAAARAAAATAGIQFIDGVEVSVTWNQLTIHLVGLAIDPQTAALKDGLEAIRSGRHARGQRIADDLARVGIPDTYPAALALAGNPDLLGRTHFARHLVERGVVKSTHAAFERYLTPGKPGYVPHAWATLEQAVAWINAAGGIAVIAHPGRYRLDQAGTHALIERFIAAGGRGIEVVTGSHSPSQYAQYATLARQYGLLASRGSDFHGLTESPFRPGTLPPLPNDLTPVWSLWTA
jgi:hypothetical protein